MQLIPVLAVRSVGVRWVGGASGEEWLERLLDETRAVLVRFPDLVDAEDAGVEAGAVVDRSPGLPEVEETGAERVVVHRIAIVAEIELSDVRVRHVELLLPERAMPRAVRGVIPGTFGGDGNGPALVCCSPAQSGVGSKSGSLENREVVP